MAEAARSYWAFISYSHQDSAWAEWLHRKLETYRVPRRLAARGHWSGELPKRLFPVFRDRAELPSSAELGPAINAALAASRYQIVICSPHAAASRWVNEEIKTFKSLGREKNILALIVDGEPNGSDKPQVGLPECFPPALRYKWDGGGLSAERTEPIAADARGGKDGKQDALLKLIAGVLDVSLDDLKQREQQRARWRMAGLAAVGILMLCLLAGVWQWQEQRKNNQAMQTRIARLIELGRKEQEQDQPARAAAYFGEAYFLGERSNALRYQLAKAMQGVDTLLHVFQHTTKIHDNWTDAGFSPDGKRIVTGGNADSKAIIWDRITGRRAMELDTGAWVGRAGYRPDGMLWTSSSNDLKFWNPLNGKLQYTLKGEATLGGMLYPRFLRDRFVVSNYADGSLRLYDYRGSQELLTLRPDARHERWHFARNGRDYAAYLEGSPDIEFWRVGEPRTRLHLRTHGSAPAIIRFSPDGRRLASLGLDGAVRLWDVQTGGLLTELRHGGPMGGLMFSPDGQRLAAIYESGDVAFWKLPPPATASSGPADPYSGWSDDSLWYSYATGNTVRLFDAESGRLERTLGGHGSQVIDATFLPGGKEVLSVGRDGSARLWRPLLNVRRQIRERSSSVTSELLEDGEHLLSLNRRGEINTWELRSGQLVSSRSLQAKLPKSVSEGRFNRDRSRLLLSLDFHNQQMFDVASGKPLASCSATEDMVCYFDDSGRWLIEIRQREAVVRDTRDGRTVMRAEGSQSAVERDFSAFNSVPLWLMPSSDGKRVAVADGRGPVRILSLPEGRELLRLPPASSTAMDLSWGWHDETVGAYDRQGQFRVWDSRDGRERANLQVGQGLISLAASPQRAMQSTEQGPLQWNLDTGKARLLEGLAANVWNLSFSPDGLWIAAASSDNKGHLWDAQTGAAVDLLTDPYSPINELKFTQDGRSLVAMSYSNESITLWPFIAPEARTPEQLRRVFACKLPWQVRGEGLVPVLPAAGCA